MNIRNLKLPFYVNDLTVIKNLIKYTLLTLLLFAGKIGYGQLIQIDSVTTDSVTCSLDSSACATVYVSGYVSSYALQVTASNLFSQANITTSPVKVCGLAPGAGPIVIVARDETTGFPAVLFDSIEINLPLDVSHTEDSVNCFGDTTGSIELDINNGVGPYYVIWNTGDAEILSNSGTSTLSGLTTGQYIYNVIDSASGCSMQDTIVYEALDSIVPSFDMSSVCVGSPITVTNTTFTKSNGVGINYLWDFPTGSPTSATTEGPHDITYYTDGSKTINMEITSDNCYVTYDTTITLQAPPVITTINDATICSEDTITLTTTGGIDYEWTPSTELSSDLVESPQAFPTNTTTYVVAGSDADGCYGRDTVTITTEPLPILTLTEDTTICIDESVNLTVSGATSYLWSPNIEISSTSSTNTTVTPSVTRYYYVTGTNSNGCSFTDSVLVTVNTPNEITVTNDTTICKDESITLTVSGADTYLWTPSTELSSATDATVTATPTSTTTYVVEGTSTNGCIDKDSVLVTLRDLPIINTTEDTTICIEESVQLTTTGAISYSWTPTTELNNASIGNPISSPTNTTKYIVFGTDADGCIGKDSVTITVEPLPTLIVSDDTTICIDASATLIVSGATTYEWTPNTNISSTSDATTIVTPTTTTYYVVTGTNANGCTVKDSVLVTVNLPNDITVTNDTTICKDESITLTVTGADSYIWSPSTELSSATGDVVIATPSTSTTFVVEGTSTNGCIDKDSVLVTLRDLPIISTTEDTTICSEESIQLNTTGGISYSWTPTTELDNATIGNPIASPTNTTKYVVFGTDADGCIGKDSITITTDPLPTLVVSEDTTICIDESATLSVSGATTYQWSPNTNISNINTATTVVTPTVTTTYYVTGTNANGCASTDSVMVTVNTPNDITVTNDTTICTDESITLTATGADTYTWSPTAELSSSTGDVVIATPSATTTFVVEGTSTNGCIDKDSVHVTLRDLPIINTTEDTTICSEESIQLNTTGGISYSWTPTTELDNATIGNPIASPTNTTKYIVFGTDADGCIGKDSITITTDPLPTLVVSEDTTICIDESATLTVSGATTYQWSPNTNISNINTATTVVTPTVTTTYYVTGTNANGCASTDSVMVTVNTPNDITVTNDTTFCKDESITLTATGADSYTWSPSAELSSATGDLVIATPSTTTTFVVEGTSTNGCIDKDSVMVTIVPLPEALVNDGETICLGDSIQLIADGGISYSWNNGSSLSSTTINNPYASPLVTTTYTVEVSNGVCTDDTTVTISVLDNAVTSVSNDTTICSGNPVQLIATGGDVYTWAPIGSLNDPNIDSPIATPDASTEYVVQISIGGRCYVFDTVQVTVNESPEPVTIGDTAICSGESVDLFTSDGLSYTWAPTTGLTTPNTATTEASPTSTTQYTVLVDNNNGCSVTDTVNVIVSPAVSANLTFSEDTICFLDTVQLTTTGGSPTSTYTWSPNDIIENQGDSTVLAVPTTNTTISVLVEGIGGCKDSAEVDIVVLTPPNLTASNDTVICSGDTIQLDASGGVDYQWIPNENIIDDRVQSPMVFPDFSTYYIVRASTGDLCPAVDSVFVEVFDRPSLEDVSDTTLCEGSSLTLNFSTFGTYTWSPTFEADVTTPNNPIFTPTTDRTYYLEFRDFNACTVFDTVNIFVSPIPEAEIDGDSSLCVGEDLTLNAVNTSNIYSWVINGTEVSNTQNLSLSGLTQDTTVNLTLENSFGCSTSDEVTVEVFNFPSLELPSDTVICGKDTINLTLDPTYNYSWSPVLEMTGEMTNTPVFFPSFTRQYIANVSNGLCATTDTMIITTEALPIVTILAEDSICFGDTVTFIGDGGVTRSWDINGTIFSTDTVKIATTEDLKAILTATSANSCQDLDSVSVVVDDSTGIEIIAPDSICNGTEIYVKANTLNLDSISWLDPNITTSSLDSVLFTITADTTIELQGFNKFGCIEEGSKSITNLSLPTLTTSPDTALCNGETVDIFATGVDSYVWLDPTKVTDPNSGNTTFIGDTTSTLLVIGTLATCSDTARINIIVNETPTGSLTTLDDELCYNEVLSANGNLATGTNHPDGTYSFDNGISFMSTNNINTIPQNDTTITLILRDASGCLSDPITKSFSVYDQLTVQIDTINFPECTGPPGAFNASNFAGGTSPYKYNFDSNDTLDITVSVLSFTDLTQGLYTFYMEDINKCSEKIDINFLSTIDFDTTITDVTCSGSDNGTISIHSVTGGEEPYEFGFNQKTTFTPTSDFTSLNGGLYSIYIKDNTDCIVQADLVVDEPDSLIANITLVKDVTCIGLDNGEVGLEITGGNPNYTITGLDTTVVTERIQFYSDIAAQTEELIITDSLNCTDTITVSINAAELYETTVSQNGFGLCLNDVLSAQIEQTVGGSGINVYSLDFGTSFKSFSETSANLIGLNSGIYTLITSDTILGCKDTTEFSIASTDGLNVDSVEITPTAPSCAGNDGLITITNLQGGFQPFAFEVLDSAFITTLHPEQLDSTFTGVSSGTKGIQITDDKNCEYLFTTLITSPTPLDTTFFVTDKDCNTNNGTVTLDAIGGSGSYSITLDTSTVAPTNVIENLDSGMYTVYYYDNADKEACLDSTTLFIQDFTPQLQVTIQNTLCSYDESGTVTIDSVLNKSDEYSYLFSIDDTETPLDTNAFTDLTTGQHSIDISQTKTITNEVCRFTAQLHYDSIVSDTFFINNLDSIKVDLTIIPDGKESSNTGSFWVHTITGGTAPYEVSFENQEDWVEYSNTDSLNTKFGGLTSGEYIAFIKDNNGCILEIIDTVGAVFNIPNIFSPNGDGVNDAFIISDHFLEDGSVLKVYDRWGALVYMRRDYDNTWDGEKQADGTYFYELKTPGFTVKGWVQIVR